MAYCEYGDSCPLKQLLQQRYSHMANRYQVCRDITDGPDDLSFVEPLMREVKSLTDQINQLDDQMKTIEPCEPCDYDNLEFPQKVTPL